MRLQLIIALVAALILVAVPLYLWRRPRPESIPSADAAVAADAGAPDAAAVAPASTIVAFDAGPARNAITLRPPTTMKCENRGPGKTPPERCDHVSTFEDDLARAIRDNPSCAPPGAKSPTDLSIVMDINFPQKKLTLLTGKSSTLKRDKAAKVLKCLKQAMPKADWGTIPHQYARYKVSVVATYPPSEM